MILESSERKVVLVTGAAHRIGRAIVMTLAGAGYDVAIHYRTSAKDARRTADAAVALGVRVSLCQADLRAADGVGRVVDATLEEMGRLDALINNASIFPSDTVASMTLRDLEENVAVNAMAPLALSRSFAAKVSQGHIVNVIDAKVAEYDAQHVSYVLSKKMLYELTSMMALEFAPGIQVNGVAPGAILPPEGKSEAYLQQLAAGIPLRRHGDPEDVADAVLFLLRSRFITGHTIFVDGGRHLKGAMHG